MSDYCDVAAGHPYHGPYHDGEYGVPVLRASRKDSRDVECQWICSGTRCCGDRL
jgi:hypothetical protein